MSTPPLNRNGSHNPADPLTMITNLNSDLHAVGGRVLNLETIVGGTQRDDDRKQEEASTLVARVQRLEDRCSKLQELLDGMNLSREQLSAIRKTLEQLTIFFAAECAIPSQAENYSKDISTVVDALNRNDDFILSIQGHSNSHFWGGVTRGIERATARATVVQKDIINGFRSQPVKQENIRNRLRIEPLRNTRPVFPGKDPRNCRVTFAVIENYASNRGLVPFPDPIPSDPDAISVASAGTGSLKKNGV